MVDYKEKYLKYKAKYLDLKAQLNIVGGGKCEKCSCKGFTKGSKLTDCKCGHGRGSHA